MNTGSTASQNMRDSARDARETVRQATAETSADMQNDLQKLREDFHRLADQVAQVIGTRGSRAWQQAKSSVDDIVADAQGKGHDAAGAMREVSDHFLEAVDDSIKTRPYTTLALVAGIAFLFGAAWRR